MKKIYIICIQILLMIIISNFAIARKISTRPASPFNGYFAGIEAGPMLSDVHANFSATSTLSTSVTELYNFDISQNAITPGIALGYGKQMRKHFHLGFLINGFYNPGETSTTTDMVNSITSTQFNTYYFKETFKTDYTANAILTPGYLINRNTLIYVMLGGAYAHMTQKESVRKTASSGSLDDESSHTTTENVWGFITGVGIKRHFTKHINVFAEYGYTVFPRFSLAGYVLPVTGDGFAINQRHNDLNIQTVMIGVDSYFNIA